MKRIAILLLLFVGFSTLRLGGQTTTSKSAPLAVDACEILAHPSRYDRKLVKVRGSYRRTAKWSGIEKQSCSDEILVVEPSDPSVMPPANFQIRDDEPFRSFKKFSEELLPGDPNEQYEANQRYKYEVVATFIGRLDSAEVRLPSGKTQAGPGFGPQGRFRARLVLESVSGVVATPR